MRVANAWAMSMALLGFVCFAAQAQELPKPKEFYFDEDASTTRAVVAVPGEGDAVVDKLASIVQRDSRAFEARAQLASIAFKGGRRELGEQLYQAALGGLSSSSQQARTVTWNYAWDLYRAGDTQQALTQWAGLINGRPSTPDWLPATLALALWKLDRRDEALQWYAAAVRTWPDRWSTADALQAQLSGWKDDERATLAEVQAAWQLNPPAWN